MKRRVKEKTLYQKIIEIAPVAISLILLVSALLNFYSTSEITPVIDHVNSIAQKADAFYSIHNNDVSRNEFTLLETQITEIQTQVNQVYKLLK